MFVLPYHTSGTSPQIGVGFERGTATSGLSTVLTGTYGNTHTMYLQTSNNTKYLYLPFCCNMPIQQVQQMDIPEQDQQLHIIILVVILIQQQLLRYELLIKMLIL